MKRTLSVVLIAAALLALPAAASAWHDRGDWYTAYRVRAELHREVRDRIREARRSIREMRRHELRARLERRAAYRREIRDVVRDARRTVHDALRDARRAIRDAYGW
jgi:hypothetical protein